MKFGLKLLMLGAMISVPAFSFWITSSMHREQNSSTDRPPSKVAFVCVDHNENFNICVTNSDGSDFKRLTDVNRPTMLTRPQINNLGQIVFQCSDSLSENICIANASGSGFVDLTIGTLQEQQQDSSPSINDNGLIAFECLGDDILSEICVINADGSGFAQVTSLDGFQSDPDINNVGKIAFVCYEDTLKNLCIVNADGTGFAQLTKFNEDSDPLSASGPMINDEGQITFLCEGPNGRKSCAINDDGTGFRFWTDVITDPSITIGAGGFLNDNGQILFVCSDEPDVDKFCVINLDGTGFKIVTDLPNSNVSLWLAFNDAGQFVYNCVKNLLTFETNLCIADINETGHEILIEAPPGERYTQSSINN